MKKFITKQKVKTLKTAKTKQIYKNLNNYISKKCNYNKD